MRLQLREEGHFALDVRRDDEGRGCAVRFAKLRRLGRSDVFRHAGLRGLALEDRPVPERAQRGVERAVRLAGASDVRRDEAHERERVADGVLEGGGVVAGRRRSQEFGYGGQRRRGDVPRPRRQRDVRPVVDGMVDVERLGERVFDDLRPLAATMRVM